MAATTVSTMSKRNVTEINGDNLDDSQWIQPSKKQKVGNVRQSQSFNPTFLSERDLQHEEDVKLHPYYFKNWQFYIQTKQEAIDDIEAILDKHNNNVPNDHPISWNKSVHQQYECDRHRLINIKFLLYERALKYLPGSYKLWYNYLTDRIDFSKPLCITDLFIQETNNCFERCLTFLHKMPRIWMMYTEFITYQRYITQTRKVFDRMLKALPITQHDRVWPLYLKFVRIAQVPEMGVRIYRRYVQLYPDQMEEFVDYLIKQKRFDEACVKLCDIVNNDAFDSIRGKSKFDFWKLLCQLLIKNAKSIKSLNVDAIIRSGIKKYPQEIGRLWVDLAEYYVRLGQFEKARDIYNEGISTVASVRDFGIVFDSYALFEENIISMKMQEMDKKKEANSDDAEEEDLFEFDDPNDLPLRIDRLEQLYQNRAILLSSVKLRQNPHNIDEWLARANIYIHTEEEEIDAEKVVETYTQSIAIIDPYKANGSHKLSAIWIAFGRFYEEYGDDIDDIRTIYQKATGAQFKNIDDLASIWCEWAEMELRHKHYAECRKVLKQATMLPNKSINELLTMKNKDIDSISVQKRLFKSKKLWAFMLDIEQSMGTLQEVKCVYNTVMDLRVASVQTILNYAELMEGHEYFEESYKVYERGIALFGYPHVLPIWKTYLYKFVQRYGEKKLERARDLFEQCLGACPKESAKEIYLMYARLEEKYGFARHAMRVYDKACLHILESDRKEMYHIYINRAADLFGITRTREIYEKAIANLEQDLLADICLSYISLELKLSEIDRARGIFQYGAQYANPHKFEYFWSKWHEFEVSFGNEDTFKEMLRIRRSVDVQYTQISYSEQIMEAVKVGQGENADTEMSELQQMEQRALQRQEIEENIKQQMESVSLDKANEIDADPNEIAIDVDVEIDLEQQTIPAAVYAQTKKVNVGALDRFNN